MPDLADHAEQFYRLQAAEEQRKRIESCEHCSGTGTVRTRGPLFSSEAVMVPCSVCSGGDA